MTTPVLVPALADLHRFLATEIGVSDYVAMSQDRIQRFADVTEDWQWIHVDVERARAESPFGGPIAHGFLTLSLLSRFLNATVDVRGASRIINVGLTSVKFLNPVPADSRVRGRVRMRECKEETDFVEVLWRVTIECEGARIGSCIADWQVRYLR